MIVQFRYLFGADTLVQITPGLTYAEYARRGFFELVFAVVLVVPVLLAADWLLDRRIRRDALVFRGLAGVQIGLVLAIAASALQRLRLYHASYGLTESRFYAMVLLIWIGAMLCWLAATVLRGRRDSVRVRDAGIRPRDGRAAVRHQPGRGHRPHERGADGVGGRASPIRRRVRDVAERGRGARADRGAARSAARRAVSARAAYAAAVVAAGPRSLDPELELVGGAGA